MQYSEKYFEDKIRDANAFIKDHGLEGVLVLRRTGNKEWYAYVFDGPEGGEMYSLTLFGFQGNPLFTSKDVIDSNVSVQKIYAACT